MHRTDLAVEVVSPDKKGGVRINARGGLNGVRRTDIVLDNAQTAKSLAREKGTYITVEVDNIKLRDPKIFDAAAGVLSHAVRDLIALELPKKRHKKSLIIGLGNRGMTADALGHKIVERIIVTRQIMQDVSPDLASVCAFCPNVLGVTGIESFEVICGLVKEIEPDLIIIADTLASRRTDRLSTAFQATNTGITPGSGLGANRFQLDKQSLGVPVITVGVPLIVYASTIVQDVLEEAEKRNDVRCEIKRGLISDVVGDLVVTPKDIDVIVDDCAYIIALALNMALHKLKQEDAKMFMTRH